MKTPLIVLGALAVTGCSASQPQRSVSSSAPTPSRFVCTVVASATLAVCRLGPHLTPAEQAIAESRGALLGAPRAAVIRYCHGVAKGRPEVVVGSPADGPSAATVCEREFPNLRTPPPISQGDSSNSIWQGDSINSIWQ